MSKKMQGKKNKRGLKRTVRRSMAAILMITAIAVAAIPVPEISADTGSTGTTSNTCLQCGQTHGELTYDVTIEKNPNDPNAKNDGIVDSRPTVDLSDANEWKEGEAVDGTKYVKAPKVFVTSGGTSGVLDWQFKVTCSKNSNDRYILDYNTRYYDEDVYLRDSVEASYDIVTMKEYHDYYYENYGTASQKENRIGHATKTSGPEFEKLKKYFANYDTFKKFVDINDNSVTELNIYATDFVNYYGTQSESMMQKYYCESNQLVGYTLFEVVDQISANPTGTDLHNFVLKWLGETELPSGDYLDSNNFKVKKTLMIIGIADRAFAPKTDNDSAAYRIKNLTLGEQIKEIGDEAFKGCTTLQTINISNVDNIGDGAFKGCTNLHSVTMNPTVIGAEAFQGTNLSGEVTLGNAVTKIGAGAFAYSPISGVSFSNCTNLNVSKFAFYNCTSLTKVNFGDTNRNHVKSIGKGCFAVVNASSAGMTQFDFPFNLKSGTTTNDNPNEGIADYVLAGRSALQKVTMPKEFSGGVPIHTFLNCTGLQSVLFPDTAGEATFDPNLFKSLSNENFYVQGPKISSMTGKPAGPRTSTWNAKNYNNVSIPYCYIENGRTYYEVCQGRYLLSIDQSTNTLTKCELNPTYVDDGTEKKDELVIPSYVGVTPVKNIGNDCFNDTSLTKTVKSLVIGDNIESIAAGAFQNTTIAGSTGVTKWQNLAKVKFGTGIKSIGENAFENCFNLTDVTFATPQGQNYTSLTIGNNAFRTNGDELTFHADINENYAPFKYAMNPDIYVKDSNAGVRIRYQSRWDSPDSKHLSVMYGEFDDGNGYITLLDYPEYDEIFGASADISLQQELQDYQTKRETAFYQKYSGAEYDAKRKEFATKWKASPNAATYNATDANGESLYGPWISPDFCTGEYTDSDGTKKKKWEWCADGKNMGDLVRLEEKGQSLYDFFFEPLVVEAANNPSPYFTQNPFKFIDNYLAVKNANPDQTPNRDSVVDYKSWDDFEQSIIDSVYNITMPSCINSIDAQSYKTGKKTATSYRTYFGATSPETFQKNTYVESIELPGVEIIPDNAFGGCTSLERLVLSDKCKEIGTLPFTTDNTPPDRCPKLWSVTIPDTNTKYKAQNGIIYEADDTNTGKYKIIQCVQRRGDSTVNDEGVSNNTVSAATDPLIASVNKIADSAFENCIYLRNADLSEATSLEEIPEACFRNDQKLVSANLPVSVNSIKADAFAGITDSSMDYRGIPALELTITGKEVFIATDAVDPKNGVQINTYKDTSAYEYGTYYQSKGKGMTVKLISDSFLVKFLDYNSSIIKSFYVEEGHVLRQNSADPTQDEVPTMTNSTFTGWKSDTGKSVSDPITENTNFIAQYDGTVGGKYMVTFSDSMDGSVYKSMTVEAGTTISADDFPSPKYHQGYIFDKWLGTGNATVGSTITDTTVFLALYKAEGSGTTSGGSTTTSGSSTSNKSTSSSRTSSNASSSTTSSSSNTSSGSSTSTSNTSNTSGSGSTASMYTVTVENGSGSGSYAAGSTVVIAANTPAAGMVFSKWTTESNGVALASVSMSATTFVMPANNVTVTANYVAGNGTAATAATGTNGNNTNGGNSATNTGKGNTTVDITKPGISNKDLATANVNGSSDNFIVKITETDEATRAVAAALTNKYGTLDNILYYAMDISLYDSTGTTKITNTEGLSIDITIPIPDALVSYGGNNMAGAVVTGDQLEDLSERFTTINGVPCISFTATHFSPYTIYVDTGNLTEGTLDVTPKTGDPIHPKWFLSIGLASLSLILFLKKDKRSSKPRKA